MLATDQPHEIPLSDELGFLEQYLAIEQVRFSDRLRVEWAIEPRAREGLVPGFMLQPLVENALKHGIATRAAAGLVEIAARVMGDTLELSVETTAVACRRRPAKVLASGTRGNGCVHCTATRRP